jgi:ketosteroid isomerase-like protein
VLVNGEPYSNTYIFVIRVRDGRIAAIAEHYNALIVEATLMPVIKTIMADAARG